MAVAPVKAVHLDGVVLEKVHQAVISGGVADYHRGIDLKRRTQNRLPLLRQPVHLASAVERIEEQPPMELGHNGPPGVDIDIIRQKLMGDDQRPAVGINEEGILHQAVKVGGDDQVVLRLCQMPG